MLEADIVCAVLCAYVHMSILYMYVRMYVHMYIRTFEHTRLVHVQQLLYNYFHLKNWLMEI